MRQYWAAVLLILLTAPVHADDVPVANFGKQAVHDNELFYTFRSDRLEYRDSDPEETLLWDISAWIGDDYNKLYVESEGHMMTDGEAEETTIELLYGRTISTFWDVRFGVRHDIDPQPGRTFAAAGIQGLARYWFEVDAMLYASEDGDISSGIEAEYDLLLSQRLIMQPRFETALSFTDVPEYAIGAGINHIALDLRLRYEIRREFAPYCGISWNRSIGKTADMVKASGEDIESTAFVAGVKMWF